MPDLPPGPLDADLEALAASRFESLVARRPVAATFLGRHDHDDRLGDISRDAAEEDIDETRAYIASLEALDAAGLSRVSRLRARHRSLAGAQGPLHDRRPAGVGASPGRGRRDRRRPLRALRARLRTALRPTGGDRRTPRGSAARAGSATGRPASASVSLAGIPSSWSPRASCRASSTRSPLRQDGHGRRVTPDSVAFVPPSPAPRTP